MWRDILVANADQVDAAIAHFIAVLEQLRTAIARRDEAQVSALLARAHAARRQWTAAHG